MIRERALILTLSLATGMVQPANAAIEYFQIPSIPDGPGVPGFPGAISVQSASVGKTGFSITKAVDSASVPLLQAIGSGTPLGTTTLLLYKGAVSSTPNVEWRFEQTFATNSQLHSGGITPTETVTFSTSKPIIMYLNLPGITGSVSRIDNLGIIPFDTLTMDAGTSNSFSVSRVVDTSSPAIQADYLNGAVLPTATLFLYDSDSPTAKDYAELIFSGVLIGSYQTQGGGDLPTETVSFSYQNVSIQYTNVPEPRMVAWMVGALMAWGLSRKTGMRHVLEIT